MQLWNLILDKWKQCCGGDNRMFVVDNPDDFGRYFSQTYIAKMDNSGVMVPWYVIGVHGNKVALRSADAAEEIQTSFESILQSFKLTTPRLGAITTESSVIYAHMVPIRQWKKGVHTTRIKIKSFNDPNSFNKDIPFIYNNIYWGVNEILEAIAKGERLGAAISHRMGIHIKPNVKKPFLSYKENIIGQITKEEIKLLNKYNLYKDYIRKTIPDREIVLWQ